MLRENRRIAFCTNSDDDWRSIDNCREDERRRRIVIDNVTQYSKSFSVGTDPAIQLLVGRGSDNQPPGRVELISVVRLLVRDRAGTELRLQAFAELRRLHGDACTGSLQQPHLAFCNHTAADNEAASVNQVQKYRQAFQWRSSIIHWKR